VVFLVSLGVWALFVSVYVGATRFCFSLFLSKVQLHLVCSSHSSPSLTGRTDSLDRTRLSFLSNLPLLPSALVPVHNDSGLFVRHFGPYCYPRSILQRRPRSYGPSVRSSRSRRRG
jgi:hypothetical protein